MYSNEISARLQVLRSTALVRELTLEEAKDAIRLLRQDNSAQLAAAQTRKTSSGARGGASRQLNVEEAKLGLQNLLAGLGKGGPPPVVTGGGGGGALPNVPRTAPGQLPLSLNLPQGARKL